MYTNLQKTEKSIFLHPVTVNTGHCSKTENLHFNLSFPIDTRNVANQFYL